MVWVGFGSVLCGATAAGGVDLASLYAFGFVWFLFLVWLKLRCGDDNTEANATRTRRRAERDKTSDVGGSGRRKEEGE